MADFVEGEPLFGVTGAAEAHILLADFLALSATGYSTFSRTGRLFGLTFSAKVCQVR